MSLQLELHEAHKARRARLGGMPPRVVRAPVRGVVAMQTEPAPQPEPEPIETVTETIAPRAPILLHAAYNACRTGPRPERASYLGIPAADIKRIIAKQYGFTSDDLSSDVRCRPLVSVRHIAVYLVHKHTQRSLNQIGKLFGDRDHTTILHALRKVAVLRETDPALAAELDYLESVICSEQQNADPRSRVIGENAASYAAASGSARVLDSAPRARADSPKLRQVS